MYSGSTNNSSSQSSALATLLSPRASSRSSSPRSKASLASRDLFQALLGRKTKVSPEKHTRQISGELKRGTVTVKRAEIFKQWTKNDPYVQVAVDEIVVGRTPCCNCYDRSPSWETVYLHMDLMFFN